VAHAARPLLAPLAQGLWDQIDVNLLPVVCSYEACGNCTKYGTFPCAWYKILFTGVGLLGLYFTRGLYTDREVTYAPRMELACDCCGFRTADTGRAGSADKHDA
jgi:hypothetical protein